MTQTAYISAQESQDETVGMIMRGELELTVDDPAYVRELADNRKSEIKEWL